MWFSGTAVATLVAWEPHIFRSIVLVSVPPAMIVVVDRPVRMAHSLDFAGCVTHASGFPIFLVFEILKKCLKLESVQIKNQV
jgi:hypothetical protein